jgi:hypothetical protein
MKFGNVDFCGKRKPEHLEKNPQSKGENQQTTQLTCKNYLKKKNIKFCI